MSNLCADYSRGSTVSTFRAMFGEYNNRLPFVRSPPS